MKQLLINTPEKASRRDAEAHFATKFPAQRRKKLILSCVLCVFAPLRELFSRNVWRIVYCFLLPCSLYPLSFSDQGTPEKLAAAIEEAMTDEEALAQTFMFGWVGAEPSPLIMNWIRERNIGGVKIFGWNTADTMLLAKTVGSLQEASLAGKYNIPLLIATDQEGGFVRHIKGSTSETPGNMAIGASGYPRDAYLSGYYIGRELALLGINMNFAPTVDLYTNRESELIGTRAFSSDPVKAGIMGSAFMKGQLAAGVIPTAKHYPGHGDTDLDSHGILPKINISFETLWDRELIPYRMLAAEGLPAVMSGHLAFPKTEGSAAPASLSAWFLKDVLRGKIGFKGIVVTDDLMMSGAISWGGNVSQTVKKALQAGNDIVLLSSTPLLSEPVWTLLVSSMKEDESFRTTVRGSARRIIELKLRHLRAEPRVPYIPDLKKVETDLPDPEGAAFFLNLAARSVTVVKPAQKESLFPLTEQTSGRVLLAGQYVDFFRAGSAAFPNASLYSYNDSRSPYGIVPYARDADTIIFCLSNALDLRVLRTIEPLGKKVIVLSVLSPALLESVPWVSGSVAVYSYAPESFIAGFSAIIGRIPAEGMLPYE